MQGFQLPGACVCLGSEDRNEEWSFLMWKPIAEAMLLGVENQAEKKNCHVSSPSFSHHSWLKKTNLELAEKDKEKPGVPSQMEQQSLDFILRENNL